MAIKKENSIGNQDKKKQVIHIPQMIHPFQTLNHRHRVDDDHQHRTSCTALQNPKRREVFHRCFVYDHHTRRPAILTPYSTSMVLLNLDLIIS